jgi:hypothetical protein
MERIGTTPDKTNSTAGNADQGFFAMRDASPPIEVTNPVSEATGIAMVTIQSLDGEMSLVTSDTERATLRKLFAGVHYSDAWPVANGRPYVYSWACLDSDGRVVSTNAIKGDGEIMLMSQGGDILGVGRAPLLLVSLSNAASSRIRR